MTLWTVQCGYARYYSHQVTVEADSLEAALEAAVEAAGDDDGWRDDDVSGPAFVDAVTPGEGDPWADFDSVLPVPARFTERGEPPLITVFVDGGAIHDVAFEGRPCRVLILDQDVEGGAPEHRETDAEGRPVLAFRYGAWPPDPDPVPAIPPAGETPDDG